MRALFLAVSVLAGVARASAPEANSGQVDVKALIQNARADYVAQKADQFSARTLGDEAEGKAFSVKLSPTDGNAHAPPVSNGSFYTFADGVLSLNLMSQVTRLEKYDDPADQYIYVLPVHETNRLTSQNIGSNGYGARVEYEKRSVQISGLKSDDGKTDIHVSHTVQIDGPNAKLLIAKSYFTVFGKISKLRSEHVAGCSRKHRPATFSSPTDLTTMSCWANVKIMRIDLTGPSGLMKSWSRDDLYLRTDN